MKKLLKYVLLFPASCLVNTANASLMFVTPSDVSSLTTSINTANSLIKDATDNNYAPGSPAGGGGGSSTYTSQAYNTWTFNFDDMYMLSSAYIWDYYGHSPTEWNLSFFGRSGSQLSTYDFTIAPDFSGGSTLHNINFADVSGVKSITLSNTNLSIKGGVGLEEVHFGGVSIPEPSSITAFGLALIGLSLRKIKKTKLKFS